MVMNDANMNAQAFSRVTPGVSHSGPQRCPAGSACIANPRRGFALMMFPREGDPVRGVKLWLNEERVSVARARQCVANASRSVACTGQNQ